MHTVKLVFLWAILGMIPGIALAQNGTNSPYTRNGYGNLADKAFISQRGMGGIGYGLRNSQMINPMNPASFSSVDSMTFMFDLGVSGQMSWLEDSSGRERQSNGNLEYIAMQFPLAKKFGFGAGFEPVSYLGYAYMDTIRTGDNHDALTQALYTGAGGQSKVYAILSYDLLQRLSIGVKLSYLFGDITRNTQVTTYSATTSDNNGSIYSDTIRSYGFLYDFGLQYHQQVGKFKTVTVGLVFSPKTRFGARVKTDTLSTSPTTGIISDSYRVSGDSVFEMPASFGLGFTYNQLGKLTVGADVLYQQWADAKFYDQKNAFNNRLKVNAGGEFIPNRTSNNLLNKLHYRGGLFFSNSYYKIYGSKYNEYGINLGIGIPVQDRRWQDKRSFINIAFEYSRVQPDLNLLAKEQYFKVSLSYTFSELWFFKQKVQ